MTTRVLVATGTVFVAAFAAIGLTNHLHLRIPLFLLLYGVAFAAYAMAVRFILRKGTPSRAGWIAIALVAVAARAVVLPARPDLSTDVYRYAWEGVVVLHGENPFALAPADSSLVPLRDETFKLINHRPLTTIYPPLAQGLFALGAAIARGVVALKLVFTVFDLGIMAVLLLLLRARGCPAAHVLIYAWSPLVIVESAHSGHLDAAGVFFLIAGIVLLASGRRLAAGILLGASVLVKYLALAMMPFLLRRRHWLVLAAMVITILIGFAPFRDAGVGLFRTLGTYGSEWSFNGPPFMTLSVLLGDGERARTVLAVMGGLIAVIAALRHRDPVRFAYIVVAAAILLSPTVYPWYLIWIVPFLCVFPSRAWILFTGLVMLSYWVWIVYGNTGAWILPKAVLALEYLPFYGLLLWDAAATDPPKLVKEVITFDSKVNSTQSRPKQPLHVAVIIPARNEEAAIGLVLDEIPRELVDEIIVVNNGSTDRTAEVARARGAIVVREETPGYGAACSAGIARVADTSNVIVTLDADYSDYPDDLAALLAPIASGDADMVIGSRTLGGAEDGSLPWNQRFGNQLACGLMRVCYGVRASDMGPFRAIRRDALDSLAMRDRTFGWNVEMHAKAVIAGLRIVEVPVRYRKRVGKSKITGTVTGTIRAGTRIIATILVYYPRYLDARRKQRA